MTNMPRHYQPFENFEVNLQDVHLSLELEALATVQALAVHGEPVTALGVLIEQEEPVSAEAIAAELGCPTGNVELVVDMLLNNGLAAKLEESGQSKYMLPAKELDYSQRVQRVTRFVSTVTKNSEES